MTLENFGKGGLTEDKKDQRVNRPESIRTHEGEP